MINNKSTLESRIALLEKLLKTNFKYRVNEEFEGFDHLDDEEKKEVKKEVALFENAVAALKLAKSNIDGLGKLKWDWTYVDDEDNHYFDRRAEACQDLIDEFTDLLDQIRRFYHLN